MAFRRNSGRFRDYIELLKPSEPERDEQGGLKTTTYTSVGVFPAMVERKSQANREIMGDYVTTQTRYFILRDISSDYAVNTDWRISYNGNVFLINDVTLVVDSVPYYVEIAATAVTKDIL